MKLFVLALLFVGVMYDVTYCHGQHITDILRPLAGIAQGIRTGGNIWGDGT
ncbi:MAG: hypothetical protein J0I47_04485 [Sphingomonas sp.]|uniref:hypothetical protein n=1 Tax=Sphingomonas sp. TaxID=28214 RepID=UPI001ACF8560|nr:hypothetical protein [Sphingomonas sp.]MBN8807482.1 hypothetical protein [Sphingomonas sp.]